MKKTEDLKKDKKLNIKLKKIIIQFLSIIIILIYIGLFIIYGPNKNFRDWLITTSMNTMNHQYFAYFFYDDEVIKDCLNRNWLSSFNSMSNTEEIKFVDYTNIPTEQITYANQYERDVLEKSPQNNDYKIIKIDGIRYNGYLAVLYEPSRIDVGVTKYLKKDGQYLTKISEENKAQIAINGGGFEDPTGHGTGGTPLGITISNRKINL